MLCTVIDAVRTRRPLDRTLANLTAFTVCPVLGGLMARYVAVPPESASFAVLVLVTFMGAVTLNFFMVASCLQVLAGVPLSASVRSVFLPVLPSEFAIGLLTAGVAFTYTTIGVSAVGLLAVVLLIFQYLIRTAVQAQERGEELEQRTEELAPYRLVCCRRWYRRCRCATP